jgi:hypothetical protein
MCGFNYFVSQLQMKSGIAVMATICLFQSELQGDAEQQAEPDTVDDKPGQRFCCAVCGAYVTDDRFKTRINQQHCHTRRNPNDQIFSFACFSAARGCQAHGDASEEHSWFVGYRWRFAHCKNCGVQLGWQFVGGHSFYGLVLEQLVDCASD